jgi:hypothetical protein
MTLFLVFPLALANEGKHVLFVFVGLIGIMLMVNASLTEVFAYSG